MYLVYYWVTHCLPAYARDADVTDNEEDVLVYRPYEPLSVPYDQRPSSYIPAHSPAPAPITTRAKTKAKPRPRFKDPSLYRWPEPQITPPPSPIATNGASFRVPLCGGITRSYILLFFWHLFTVSISIFVILRVVFKPRVCLSVVALLTQLALFFF
ncbi:hypothetical protein C8F04DRAFT_1269541 [Mycena alexandri]|uniref:Uncharacterized protein n=1 Tax=Mycena alexandri TaxID=1745969 RepID=A0AAD6SCZ1_9AGAR|nr:hypothetical protein C8F04DRAFT_1269541 [Mycena alexandri]